MEDDAIMAYKFEVEEGRPNEKSLEDKVKHAKSEIREKHWCPYQYSGYHILYCDLSENDIDVPCCYIGPVIVEHDGLEYHECKYSSERSEVKCK